MEEEKASENNGQAAAGDGCKFAINEKLTLEISVAVVEKDDADLSSIVLVNDTSASVNKVLYCEARARSHTAVGVVGDGDSKASLNDAFATSRDEGILSTVKPTI